jgi:diguanylate cyclase (GGDEF)-like protein
MDSFSLKGRAISFAMCAGAVAFILALVASSQGKVDGTGAALSLIVAVVCGTMCWAAAECSVSVTASAIDQAIDRLTRATQGDLRSEIPVSVREQVPPLAQAMDNLFSQLGANLESTTQLALFDSVTGLPNRTHFRNAGEELLRSRSEGEAAALLFIDLDRFKSINDTLGHACGDMLLGAVATRLRKAAETAAAPGAVVGRLEGDEFTMLAPGLANRAAALGLGQAILDGLAEPFTLTGQEVRIGASIGLAVAPDHGASLAELMRAADVAMYQAKAGGRGRVELFSAELAAEMADRVQLDSDLREALARQEFALVFQPQVRAHDGQPVAAEALLRWRHRDGIKLPSSFIRRAEETGFIVEIGQWVLETVACTLSRWAAMGVEQRLAINVSPREMDQAEFFRELRAQMRRAGAPARLLELEISEAMVTRASDELLDAVAGLRRDGATVSLDGFGVGHSSIPALRRLPLDAIKSDRSLTAEVADNAEARSIAQALINLIHGLGCRAVAQGIESAAQADVLRVIGCDMLQGFAIAEPMDEMRFVAWCRRERFPALVAG